MLMLDAYPFSLNRRFGCALSACSAVRSIPLSEFSWVFLHVVHASRVYENSPEEINMARETGIVKWFNESKGFGFIAPDNGGKDLFAHFKEIEGSGFRTLQENQKVEFEVVQGQKGPAASRIRPV